MYHKQPFVKKRSRSMRAFVLMLKNLSRAGEWGEGEFLSSHQLNIDNYLKPTKRFWKIPFQKVRERIRLRKTKKKQKRIMRLMSKLIIKGHQ